MRFFILLIVAVLFGIWTFYIAVNKGYSAGFFWLGFFFPLIGVIIAASLTDKLQEASPQGNYAGASYLSHEDHVHAYQSARAAPEPVREKPIKPTLSIEDGKKMLECTRCGKRVSYDFAFYRKECPNCSAQFQLVGLDEEVAKASEADKNTDKAHDPKISPVPDCENTKTLPKSTESACVSAETTRKSGVPRMWKAKCTQRKILHVLRERKAGRLGLRETVRPTIPLRQSIA